MRCWRGIIVLAGAVCGVALAQKPKEPAFPPLNLGVAKLAQTAKGLDGPAVALAFSPDKKRLVVGCESGNLRVWAQEDDKDLLATDARPVTLKAHTGPVTSVAAGGAVVASGGTDGKVRIWKLPADKPAHTLKAADTVRAVAVSPDGKTVASAGDDAGVQLWDPATGKAGKKLEGPKDWLRALAFSPDNKHLAAGGHDGKLWVWEVGSGKKLFDVVATAPAPPKKDAVPEVNVVSALAFSPDGKQIALGGSDARIYLFQSADGKFVRQTQVPGHTCTITALAFHPGNAVLVSASKDRSLRIWNPANGQALKTLDGHTAWAQGVLFLDRGTRLASASADRTVRIWDLVPPAPKKKK
jgi:WD40 repeat protein